jgi:ribose transport system substrate-binding protein
MDASRTAKKALLSGIALAVAVAAAACSSSSGSTGSGSTATATASPDVKYAEAQIAAAMKDPAAPVPSAAIKDLSKLSGKTIYYIPISDDVPAFAITAAAMKTALATVGVKLNVCSGNFDPSQFDSCFSQAIGASAAAVVTDSIPYQLTAAEIKQASAKGIGVVVTDQNPDAGRPTASNVAYISGNDQQYQLAQDWMIADSGGKADVLELEATDSPTSQEATADYALPEIKAHCSGCSETVLKFSSSSEQDLPSLISAALLKNPDIDYISPQYDQYVSFVTQGIQQATATTRVKMAASASALSGLQDVASASSTVKAEIADNQVYNGWIDADEAMRMALGDTAVPYTIPIRLFTSSNIGSVQLTNAGLASGSWFGSTAYQKEFETLWAVK